ncbi:MAG: tRNA lysidine(34) synthetase TilS [Candidatus Cloacimonetes bacterium]|nr:tRNA lysidine(34) synthetase TilS [Candidatus Cloacimonadota bacterium]
MDFASAQKKLTDYIKHKHLINSGDKVIITCSAGADSTALLVLLSSLRHSLNISILAVHVNHQLRGRESQNDEDAIRQLCLSLNVPLIIRKISIPSQGNLESLARSLRFEVFYSVLHSYKFDKILLAHHKNDQAETVLFNMFRGSGLGGMAGIKPIYEKVVHPMLCFTHAEIESILIAKNITWCEDASNNDNNFSRNRLRNDLIPKIAKEYNPAIVERLARQAEIVNQADKLLKERSKLQFKRISIDVLPHKVILDLAALLKLSSVEQYYIFRQAFRTVCGLENDFLTSHSEAIEDILASQGCKELILSHGVKVRKLYDELIFYLKDDEATLSTVELEIDADRARAVYGDYRFSFKYLKVLPKDIEPQNGEYQILVDADKVNYPFKIRCRHLGDRFIPFGMTNFKRLKEFFIDEKVPKFDRDFVPILDDGEKIFWIVGHRIDNRVRYDENSSHYLQIIAESTAEKPKRAANRKKP